MRISDWSSDVCSSDLLGRCAPVRRRRRRACRLGRADRGKRGGGGRDCGDGSRNGDRRDGRRMTAATAFKILTAQQWADFERERVFRGAPVDVADGYIHPSTADQLEGTLAKHFADERDLRIAEVDLGPLGDAVRWEESRGGALYPHLYGELPMHAVVGLSKRD